MDVTRIRKKAVQKDKLQEGIRPDRLGPFLFWRCFLVHLPRQSEGQGHPVAVAAAGRGHYRGGLSALCIGAGPDGDHAAPGGYRAVRLPRHPGGGLQRPGLPAAGGLLSVPAAAIL